MKKIYLLLIPFIASFLMASPLSSQNMKQKLYEGYNDGATEFNYHLGDILEEVESSGPFTVFAPTFSSWKKLPDDFLKNLLEGPREELKDFLLYHVVEGSYSSEDFYDGQMLTALNGKTIDVSVNSEGIFLNDSRIVYSTYEYRSGRIHFINAVLIPPTTTVVDIIVGSEVHETLEAAVIAAGLADDLSMEGPFTVFAPTDAAFAALPAGLVESLLEDPEGALKDILLYHVVEGKALSTDLSDGQMIETLNGKEVKVKIMNDTVYINDAMVTIANIEADNGVVHVINAVLIPPTTTVVDIIVGSEVHETLEAAVIAAGLADDLSTEGPFTVFAPTDAAFAALPAGLVESLLEDPEGALKDILLYHVVEGKALSTDLSDGQMIETLNGKEVKVKIMNDTVYINDAMVTIANIEADNGVVHVINAVLIPPTTTVVDIIVGSEVHETLEAAVIAAGLADDLSMEGPFTVFAPTDAAFAALPAGLVESLLEDPEGALKDILLYHVVEGKALSTDLSDGQMIETLNGKEVKVKIMNDTVYINDAMVTIANIEADNGVVHVINAVLIPPTTTVVDIIVGSEVHETLEAAVIAAGLADDLSMEGPFTVFAPTDAAFAALPAGLVESLLEDPEGALKDILLYHVVEGKALSTDLSDGQMIETLNGKEVKVKIMNDTVYINDAMVTIANIEADNGVVHVINAVLIPPTTTVVDIIVGSEVHETLEAAVIAAGLADDLSMEGPFTVFAPTDAAFAALPAGLVESLLEDPEGALKDILLYHVVEGKALSTDLSDGQMIETLNGKEVKVKIMNDTVYINDAMVTIANIEADNGVVHVINAVLIPPTTTVVDIIVGSEVHETLEAAVIAAGLADDLSMEGPFTVFAPTDDAFAALPAGLVESLLEDPEGALKDILLYHVVEGKALSTDLSDGQMIETLNGKEVKVKIMNDTVYINDAMVTIANIEADNGVVHVINAVLIPPTTTVVDIIVGSEVHETLEAAVIAAGLADDLSMEGPFTVFAPTDAAFAALPAGLVESLLEDPEGALKDILLYHVVEGKALSTDLSDGQMIETLNGKEVKVKIMNDTVYINDAMVTIANIEADNGVVHVINAVLIPPTTTVVDIIVGSEVHETLEAAVIAAGLADDLSTEGPFTVFAPTDAAFAALPAGLVESLLEDPEGALKDILLYHVVEGKALSTDLSDGQMIETLNGKEVKVKIMNDTVYINDAMVTIANIEADNGVVHVINAVLIPPTTTSVNDLETLEDKFSFYPNPARGYINTTLDFESDRVQIQIIDIRGNIIKSEVFYNVNRETRSIDLYDLSTGYYFIRVTGNNMSFSKKLNIIQ